MHSETLWKVALPAAFCTVGVFLLLPALDFVSRRGAAQIRVLPVDTVRVQAAPVPVVEPPPARAEPPTFVPPLPQLAQTVRRLPIGALLQMPVATLGGGGQFDVGFRLSDDVRPGLGNMVFSLNELDQAPVPVLQLDPMYPPRAKADRVKGEVELEFVVTAEGDVSGVVVVASRPGDLFSAAAVRAAEGWTFQPGMREGKPVAVRVRQKVSFNLQP